MKLAFLCAFLLFFAAFALAWDEAFDLSMGDLDSMAEKAENLRQRSEGSAAEILKQAKEDKQYQDRLKKVKKNADKLPKHGKPLDQNAFSKLKADPEEREERGFKAVAEKLYSMFPDADGEIDDHDILKWCEPDEPEECQRVTAKTHQEGKNKKRSWKHFMNAMVDEYRDVKFRRAAKLRAAGYEPTNPTISKRDTEGWGCSDFSPSPDSNTNKKYKATNKLPAVAVCVDASFAFIVVWAGGVCKSFKSFSSGKSWFYHETWGVGIALGAEAAFSVCTTDKADNFLGSAYCASASVDVGVGISGTICTEGTIVIGCIGVSVGEGIPVSLWIGEDTGTAMGSCSSPAPAESYYFDSAY